MILHVIKTNDIKEHEETTTCECSPRIEFENGEMIVIHNSFDVKEIYEQETGTESFVEQNLNVKYRCYKCGGKGCHKCK